MGGASNALPLTVTSRTANGRVTWRFQMDASYAVKRPAVGPDGTVYALDIASHLYALSPDGGLKWLVTVGSDGTVYTGNIRQINAFNPDGTRKWTYSYLYALDTSGGTTSPPPSSDTVSITQAQYTASKHELRVSATSTSATATLQTYVTSTNQLIGTLANNGGGKYSGQFSWPSNPGGSATQAVTAK